jgi:hypothetical protein
LHCLHTVRRTFNSADLQLLASVLAALALYQEFVFAKIHATHQHMPGSFVPGIKHASFSQCGLAARLTNGTCLHAYAYKEGTSHVAWKSPLLQTLPHILGHISTNISALQATTPHFLLPHVSANNQANKPVPATKPQH